MRGSVSGGLWGLVLGGVSLSVASLVNEQPASNDPPEVPQLGAPQVAQVAPASDDLIVTAPATLERVVEAPRVAAPEAEVAAPALDTELSPPPQTAEIEPELTVPEDISPPQITVEMEETVLPAATITPPEAPEPEEEIAIAVQQPAPAPDAVSPDTADVAGLAEDADVVQSLEDAAVAELPVVEEVEVATPEIETPDVPVVEQDAPRAIDVEDDVIAELEAITEPEEETVATGDTPVEEAPEPTAPVIVADAADDPAPATSSDLPRVRVTRPEVTDPTPEPTPEEVTPEDAIAEDAPALERYAAAFENPDNLPLMSVILLDDGAVSDGPVQVAGLPFPATVILDPLATSASARMASYREFGVEIGMQTPLPEGATPADVEVAFEAAFAAVGEAVVLFSDGTGAMQSDRAVTQQVVQFLASDGRGLVAIKRGLGDATRAAEQVNVPATTIFRDLDGEGQDETAIGRALDQAAFRARQNSGVVLLARVAPATLAALRGWDDDGQVARAPISALLMDMVE